MATKRGSPLRSCGLLLALSAPGLLAQQIPQDLDGADAQSTSSLSAAMPKRPAEMTPNAPKVTCQGSELSIQAENSSLRGILAAVHSCLGIAIEIPESFADSRAYLNLGPGPAREVLDALLSSTDLNYVIQSDNAAPSKVETVLLMARLKDPKDAREPAVSPGHTMTPARRAWAESRRNGRPAQAPVEEITASEAQPESPVEEPAKAFAAPPELPVVAVSSPAASDASQTAQTSEKAIADASGAADPSAGAVVAAAAVPDAVSTNADPSEDAAAKKVLQGKIGAMEQLFEQRKQMIANPPAATDPR